MMAFGFGGFSMFFMFIFWIVIAGLVVWALLQFLTGAPERAASNGRTITGSRQSSALDVLKQRYARGEISKDEFDDMRHELSL